MQEFNIGDFVNHAWHGSTLFTVVSPPALNNNEYMVAEYQDGIYCNAVTDSPSKFTLVKKKDKA